MKIKKQLETENRYLRQLLYLYHKPIKTKDMKIKEKAIMLDIISLLTENRNVSLFINNKRYFVDNQTQLIKVSRLIYAGLSKGYEIKTTEY